MATAVLLLFTLGWLVRGISEVFRALYKLPSLEPQPYPCIMSQETVLFFPSLCMCGVFFSLSEEESDEDRIKVILTSGEFPYF